MRIISGYAGGVKLQVPKGMEVRPTGDRVKGSLFNSLGDISGFTVVDLCAGAGSLGLEALSRGAAEVIMVERNSRTCRMIEDNISAVKKAAGENCGKVEILNMNAATAWQYLPNLSGKVDLVLADPPYYPEKGEFGAVSLLQDTGFAKWAGQALLVLEHDSKTYLPLAPETTWHQFHHKQFGITTLSFCQQKKRTDKKERRLTRKSQ